MAGGTEAAAEAAPQAVPLPPNVQASPERRSSSAAATVAPEWLAISSKMQEILAMQLHSLEQSLRELSIIHRTLACDPATAPHLPPPLLHPCSGSAADGGSNAAVPPLPLSLLGRPPGERPSLQHSESTPVLLGSIGAATAACCNKLGPGAHCSSDICCLHSPAAIGDKPRLSVSEENAARRGARRSSAPPRPSGLLGGLQPPSLMLPRIRHARLPVPQLKVTTPDMTEYRPTSSSNFALPGQSTMPMPNAVTWKSSPPLQAQGTPPESPRHAVGAPPLQSVSEVQDCEETARPSTAPSSPTMAGDAQTTRMPPMRLSESRDLRHSELCLASHQKPHFLGPVPPTSSSQVCSRSWFRTSWNSAAISGTPRESITSASEAPHGDSSCSDSRHGSSRMLSWLGLAGGIHGFWSNSHQLRALSEDSDSDTESRDSHYIEFEMLEHWMWQPKPSNHSLSTAKMYVDSRKFSTTPRSKSSPSVDLPRSSPAPWFMIEQNSPQRQVWDVLSAMIVAYDVVTSPLQFLEIPWVDASQWQSWSARVFWSFDLPLNFITGYDRLEGDPEMRPRPVARMYLRTWFTIDLLAISADWFNLLLGGEAGKFSHLTLSVVRCVRLLRFARILRAGRLTQVYERVSHHVPMQVNFFLRAAASVVKIMSLILLVAHMVACSWYAVGHEDAESDNWIAYNNLDNSDPSYVYFTAVHWSLTQFSGTMEVTPRNLRERIFAVITLVFSFMMSNVFVSSLTSTMTHFHMAASRQTKMFIVLRRYLQQKNISPALALRLHRNAMFAFEEQQRNVEEEDVELLTMVSEPLVVQLHFEMYAPQIAHHPFFEKCVEENRALMHKVCHSAVRMSRNYMAGDVVFACGEDPGSPSMFFTTSGVAHYTIRGEDISASQGAAPVTSVPVACMRTGCDIEEEVKPSTWLCEGMLWVNWHYLGELRAGDKLHLMVLDVVKFHQAVLPQKATFCQYARSFAVMLSRTPVRKLSDIGSARLVLKAMHD